MKRITCIAACVAAALLYTGCSSLDRSRSLANPDVPAKATAEQVCSICHGMDGNSINPNFPRLAAQQEAYVIGQLKEFRGHNRMDPAGAEYMWGLSRHLTDAQIEGLAKYYAAQTPTAPPPTTPPSSPLIDEGRKIFEGGVPDKNIPPCATCHGDKAQGNEAFPRLADQHADYLLKQLTVFQRTDERPEGSVMKTIAHDLTQANMEAVAAYLEQFPAK